MPVPLFSYKKYWPHCLLPAPVLPMTREEMDMLGWDSCDVVLVTGDAYIDHPSFGMALIGRLLEAQGFRVGILAQPDWQNVEPFRSLGKPNLFFGVTSGNMESMVNRYTADKKIRSDDAYSPNGAAGKRPDRATIVYAQRCREAYPDCPIILGGIEASLRRMAHFDYWSEKVRRSVLVDAKADLLIYGNAERAIVEIAHRMAQGEAPKDIRNVRGTVFVCTRAPLEVFIEVDSLEIEPLEKESAKKEWSRLPENGVIRVPSYEAVSKQEVLYAHASRVLYLQSNPHNAKPIVQGHGKRDVWITPPSLPLTMEEMDWVYGLPYTRLPHPFYGKANFPAYEMIKFSVNIMRGCFGGCSFCSLTAHEGKIVQSRSEDSVLLEIETIRDKVPGFTGMISDLGGPTANMYRMGCIRPDAQKNCRRFSCIYPNICKNLDTNHTPLLQLYRKAREVPGVKKILIGSGVRYDLAMESREYVRELALHHVGGYLKVAPEHTQKGPLSLMMKPPIEVLEKFEEWFRCFSSQGGKEQYLVPYFIAAHPGTTEEDMLCLALWLKEHDFRPDQVQTFLPSPMTVSTTQFHTGHNPVYPIVRGDQKIYVPDGLKIRRLHKAFLRYHDPSNWPVLREALVRMKRSDLIGHGKQFLVPPDSHFSAKDKRKRR